MQPRSLQEARNIGHCTEQLYQFYQSRLKEEEGEGPEEEYEVEQILDHRYLVESEYRVKWVGVAEESWVPESNMTNCPVLLTEFWEERQKELDDLRQEVMVSRENHAMESDLATSRAKPSCVDSGGKGSDGKVPDQVPVQPIISLTPYQNKWLDGQQGG